MKKLNFRVTDSRLTLLVFLYKRTKANEYHTYHTYIEHIQIILSKLLECRYSLIFKSVRNINVLRKLKKNSIGL